MLKTLLFTLQNGKNISSGMQIMLNSAQTKKERALYFKIYGSIKEGATLSQALKKYRIGSLDIVEFISMAEKGLNFKKALERIISYLDVKDAFKRESEDKTSLPTIYLGIASLVVLGIKFIAVPMQIEKAKGYSPEIINNIAEHLISAQVMTDILFIGLVFVASYFMILMFSLFSSTYVVQGVAKQLALVLPLTSKIVVKFEKFILFNMMGEMLQSGISYKKTMESVLETTTVSYFKQAIKESLDSIKYDGKLILHNRLFDPLERELLAGVGSSAQIGSVMVEVSNRVRTDALSLSTKFFRLITVFSILLLSFAVFIEFYTVVLTQILIQKGLIDLTRGTAF